MPPVISSAAVNNNIDTVLMKNLLCAFSFALGGIYFFSLILRVCSLVCNNSELFSSSSSLRLSDRISLSLSFLEYFGRSYVKQNFCLVTDMNNDHS